MKKKAFKRGPWTPAQRRKHSATIAARKAAKDAPIAARKHGAAWIDRPDTAPGMGLTPAPGMALNESRDPETGLHKLQASGVADHLDAIKLIRSTGEGLVALAGILERMDREHAVQWLMKGFGLKLDLTGLTHHPIGGGASVRPS